MLVSVVIVAYNSGPALLRCLDSLPAEAAELEVVVVNNGDNGPELEQAAQRPSVEVLQAGTNLGFAAGCNLGAKHSRGDVLLFLNPDTVVESGAIEELARTVSEDGAGAAMGKLVLLSDPGTLNSRGAVIHIAGLGWSSGLGEPAGNVTRPAEITYANGSALAMRRELFEELGGYTEELFLYHEDLELGWRARMRGERIVLNPTARVLHDYEHARNPEKYYFMERNRLVFVASAYSGRLLLLLAPVLVLAELGLTVVSISQGWFRAKVRGWRWVGRNRRWILGHRRRLQAARTVPDRELAEHLTPVVDAAMIELPTAVRIANPMLSAYWGLVRRLL